MTRWRVGLTGGIGSGKSTVAAFWVARGASLIDTDAIARALTCPGGDALPALRGAFGESIINSEGALDRDRMRELAFADPSARRQLEALLHPLIGAAALSQAARATETVVVFDVPLLAESTHWRGRCDRILVVDCSESTQIARVSQRSGWTAEQVRRVVAQQSPRDVRRGIADAVIHNDGCSLSALRASVDVLWDLWAQPR